ncbi:MAG TPA: hypothetical protein VFB60_21100 [Ktedonobacteraceae bacterium]|nr:hypothetical protein [Ktedonobacteraceae bacterium]
MQTKRVRDPETAPCCGDAVHGVRFSAHPLPCNWNVEDVTLDIPWER